MLLNNRKKDINDHEYDLEKSSLLSSSLPLATTRGGAIKSSLQVTKALIFFMVLSLVVFYLADVGHQNLGIYEYSNWYSGNSDNSDQQHYSVWLYDSPPPPNANIVAGDVIVCAYEACRKAFETTNYSNTKLNTINLRELSDNTIFGDFIKSHQLNVLVLGDAYPHHIQSVGLLLIAGDTSNPVQNCARTMGALREEAICLNDLRNYENYNPKTSVPLVTPSEATQQDRYGVLDMSHRLTVAPVANSGDEMQLFAGAQLVPYVNEYVDRDAKTPEATSWILLNAWWGERFEWPPSLEKSNPTVTSVHYSSRGKGVVKANLEWYKEYNAKVGKIGARDMGTLAFLEELGIQSYFSACATLTIDLGFRNDKDLVRNKIIIVDVDMKHIPDRIVKDPNTIYHTANIPNSVNKQDRNERGNYAFMLASEYAKEAKLVITSRIHSALPAAAQGVPVIFVDTEKLPGGGGGRTTGLMELFHIYQPNGEDASAFEWDPDNMKPNPGIHKIDRYRASFWDLFGRRSQVFKDSGYLYGHLPLKRLGAGIPVDGQENLHDLFHMIYTTQDVSWRVIRSIEHIFYHHPNAKVVVHSISVPKEDNAFLRFAEAGYDLVVEPYDLKELVERCNADAQSKDEFFNRLPEISVGKSWYSHETDLVRAAVLYLEGGVYLDTDMYLLKPLSKNELRNTWSRQSPREQDANVAMLIFDKSSPMLLRFINRFLKEYDGECWGCNGPSKFYWVYNEPAYHEFSTPQEDYKSFYPYMWDEAHKCFNEKVEFDWDKDKKQFTNSWSVHLNTKMTSKFDVLMPGTVCHDLLQRFCIFCDEIH